jgi:hypothetical protein
VRSRKEWMAKTHYNKIISMRGNMRRDKGGLEVNEYMYSNTKYKGMFPEVDILKLLRVSKHGCQTIHYRSIG